MIRVFASLPGRATRWRAFTALLGLGLLLGACSADRQLPPIDVGASLDALVASELGPEIRAEAVVAEVGDHSIRAVDLALYLEQMGGLTPSQALDDLVDAALLAQSGLLEQERRERALEAGRSRGLASSWMRHEVLDAVPPRSIGSDAVESAIEAGEPFLPIGMPALRTASHLLLQPPPEQASELEAPIVSALEALHAELVALDQVDVSDLEAAAERLREAPPAPDIRVVVDTHLTFPREARPHAGWRGIGAVVEPFARASFEAAPGTLTGPVETEFGWHLILVERAHDAVEPDPEEVRTLMHARLLAEARQQHMVDALAALEARTRVRVDEDTVELILLDEIERAQRQYEQMGEQQR